MNHLKQQLAALPAFTVGGQQYLAYQAVTDTVAALLFPDIPADEIGEADYQHILKTAAAICHELGYRETVKLMPPAVSFSQSGLYWRKTVPDENESTAIIAGPGRVEMLQEGRLLDARLSQLGLDEISRQHFTIPVTASDGVIDLMRRAVDSEQTYHYRSLWADICGMAIAGGKDISLIERRFTVIIHGLGRQRYWHFRALLKHDASAAPFLSIRLLEEPDPDNLFEPGHIVMTPGVAALNIDLAPFLARHLSGDWSEMEAFDRQQNDRAVRNGLRILSAYDVPLDDGTTARIWLITEADRSATTILLVEEY
jgi:hypothetical protein